jgi:phenylacetate-CoA ligase
MAFFGATRGHFAGVSIASTGKSNVQNWFYETRTFEINQPINIVTDHLTEFQPDVLTGYPTALRVLAEKQLEGSLNIQPSSIHCSGEPTTPETRIAIEKAFSVPITNIYMSTEHLFMGIAHPGGERMSLLEDDLIFEFYQDHTLVTNLFNYTLPLIRYRMNDVLTPLSDISRSYPYTYVENLVGRLEHTPVFTNRHGHDDFISPYLFIEFFVKDLERFQMKIESKKFFIFKISLNKKIGSEKKSEVRSQIQEKLRDILDEKEMENVSFEIQETDDLSQGERNGKFDLIVPA